MSSTAAPQALRTALPLKGFVAAAVASVQMHHTVSAVGGANFGTSVPAQTDDLQKIDGGTVQFHPTTIAAAQQLLEARPRIGAVALGADIHPVELASGIVAAAIIVAAVNPEVRAPFARQAVQAMSAHIAEGYSAAGVPMTAAEVERDVVEEVLKAGEMVKSGEIAVDFEASPQYAAPAGASTPASNFG